MLRFSRSSKDHLDIGCGLGVSAFYLRERGFENPVMGIDYDAKKIEAASVVAKANYSGMEFHAGDAREGVPDFSGNVTILDILQFFEQDERGVLLRAAARSVAEGGKLVIRSGVVDDSWRFRITRWADFFAKATFWMKAAPISYPTIPEIATVLEEEGLRGQASPLWGNTPFNNYFFVFER